MCVLKKSFAELAMPTQRKEPRTNAGKRLFLKALERKKVLAISCVMNILPLLDAVLGVLENDKCLKRKGLQLVQLLLATTLLASSVLPHSYISPHCKMPTIDENPWVVQGTSDQFMDLFRFRRDDIITMLAELRVSIENFFAESHLMFNYMSASAQLKLGSVPIGQYYAVCTMLMNVHAIFYGNQILEKLGYSSLPSVEEYLGA